METQQATHTPTPWTVDSIRTSGHGKRSIFTKCIIAGEKVLADMVFDHRDTHKEDAAFIVRAVNNYEQMLLALKNIALLNEAWETTLYHPIKKMAMAAIAKAEEK